jgi:shikimate dehydrogenase
MARTLLGVVGHPVGHSRSPAMQNAALRELGLDWLYVPVPLPPERFTAATLALPGSGFRGVNVTVPHKVAANELAGERTRAAAEIGAANTLTFTEGGVRADNTDAGGLLDAVGEVDGLHALVLGAGGSARAAVWALRESRAAEVSVWNRTPERAAAVATSLGARHVDRPPPADLIVNCTVVGLDPRTDVEAALDALALKGSDPSPTVVDLVYRPGGTPLASWAEAAGSAFVGGLEVLVHQGARSLEEWTGRPAPRQAMHLAVADG